MVTAIVMKTRFDKMESESKMQWNSEKECDAEINRILAWTFFLIVN